MSYPIFSALFWIPAFAGVTLFDSFEIGLSVYPLSRSDNFFLADTMVGSILRAF